jgi:anthranilate phosphoribosyltransferase
MVMLNPLKNAVERLAAGESLTAEQAEGAATRILDGSSPDGLTAAFLTALHVKGECPEELLGAVRAIRAKMIPWLGAHDSADLLDTCGTGGDGAGTVNVSTAAAIVAAASGIPVVKHGNRAASGTSGSSDVLTALGIGIDVDPLIQRDCFQRLGLAFLFAPRYHPGLKAVASIRSQLPFRTLFNLVGPLCNPASPGFQLVGVPRDAQADLMAGALAGMPHLRRAVVVTGGDGLDEVTLDGPTRIQIIEASTIRRDVWQSEDFGLEPVRAQDLRVSSSAESASRIQGMLDGEDGPVRRIVLANTAAALWTAGKFTRLRDAVDAAANTIDSGTAARLVARWAELTRPASNSTG